MKFYLGTHMVHWLWTVDVPLFLSRRRLERNKVLKPALNEWMLDSGGFSELSLYGKWRTTPKEYVQQIRRYQEHLGNMKFAAQQDWMCEDFILQKTGLKLRTHQRRTIDNFLELKSLAPDIPFMPVIQGFTADDYFWCINEFEKAGVNLKAEPRVGLGSICRRQNLDGIASLVRYLRKYEVIKLHGFGVKMQGIKSMKYWLKSADSMAWSFNARNQKPLPECEHRTCSSCVTYALKWYNKVISL